MIEIIVLSLALAGGSFAGGWYVGESRCEASHAEIQQAIEDTRRTAQDAAAKEIAKIKVENTVIQNEVEREVRVVQDYSICKHSPKSWEAIQKAFGH